VHLQFKPGIGASVKPLNAHLLQLTVDRLNRMTIRAQFDVVHKPGVWTHGRPAHRNQAHPRLRQDAGLISGALGGGIAQPPRPGGQHRNASGHAIWAADQMHTPSKARLPFGGALPAACAPAHRPTAPGAHTTADWQGEAIDHEPVARGEHLPQHFRNPGHPIGALMQTTIAARDADPSRQRAAPVHDLHRPFVMTAKLRGGEDGNRQHRGVVDLRPPITALPQVFHQRVDHDKRRYHHNRRPSAPPGDDGGSAPAIMPEVSMVVN